MLKAQSVELHLHGILHLASGMATRGSAGDWRDFGDVISPTAALERAYQLRPHITAFCHGALDGNNPLVLYK